MMQATGGFWSNIGDSLADFGADAFETVTEKSSDIVDGLANFEYQKWMAEKIGEANLGQAVTNEAQNASGQPSQTGTVDKVTQFASDNALIIGGVVVGSLALFLLLRRK